MSDASLVVATKRCARCESELPVSQFYKNTRGRDGLQGYCKGCSRRQVEESKARRRAELGEEEYLARQRAVARKARSKPGAKARGRLSTEAYNAATAALRAAHRAEFDALLARERYERGLS